MRFFVILCSLDRKSTASIVIASTISWHESGLRAFFKTAKAASIWLIFLFVAGFLEAGFVVLAGCFLVAGFFAEAVLVVVFFVAMSVFPLVGVLIGPRPPPWRAGPHSYLWLENTSSAVGQIFREFNQYAKSGANVCRNPVETLTARPLKGDVAGWQDRWVSARTHLRNRSVILGSADIHGTASHRLEGALNPPEIRFRFLDMFGDPDAKSKGWLSRPLGEALHPDRPISYGILKPGEYQENNSIRC